jgi:hypothetical protein
MPKGGQTVSQGKVPVPTVISEVEGGDIERCSGAWDERGALLSYVFNRPTSKDKRLGESGRA